ncbi:MAG: cupin domain-containing protein [Dysgonomonas sp.]
MEKEIIKGEVWQLASAVEYSTGGVISKQIIKSSAGNITLFSFDKGQGLSEHSAPFDAFVQVLEGEVEIKIGGVPHKLSSGESIIMPANITHALHAVEKFKMLLTMIKA